MSSPSKRIMGMADDFVYGVEPSTGLNVKRVRAPEAKNGGVKVLVPADPDKLAAWRASPDGIRASFRASRGKTDFNYGKDKTMGALKKKLMQDQEDGIVEDNDED